jgi:hypothetical protein
MSIQISKVLGEDGWTVTHWVEGESLPRTATFTGRHAKQYAEGYATLLDPGGAASRVNKRYLLVSLERHDAETVARYLPANYSVIGTVPTGHEAWPFENACAVVCGTDQSGWTLDDYVIPRLVSGVFSSKEIKADHPAVQFNLAGFWRTARKPNGHPHVFKTRTGAHVCEVTGDRHEHSD